MIAWAKKTYLLAMAALMMATPAFAAGDIASYVKSKITGGGWLPVGISFGFVVLAVYYIINKWEETWGGQNIFKNGLVALVLLALIPGWKEIVEFALSLIP